MPHTSPPNIQIVDEAADWAVRIDAGNLTAEEHLRLSDWLKASPVHIEELLFATALMTGVRHTSPDLTIDPAELQTGLAAENVHMFPDTAQLVTPEPANENKPQTWKIVG